MRPKLENSQFFALFFSILFQYGSFLDLNLHKISYLDDMALQLCWLPLKTPFQSEVCNTSIFKLPDPNVILLMLEFSNESRPAAMKKAYRIVKFRPFSLVWKLNIFMSFFNSQKVTNSSLQILPRWNKHFPSGRRAHFKMQSTMIFCPNLMNCRTLAAIQTET